MPLSLTFHACLCLSSHVCLSLSSHVCLCLCLSLFIWLSSHVSLGLCVWLCVLLCVVLGGVGLCVLSWCVRFFLSCTEKTLPCVRSKRPCHTGHVRFECTNGSVLNVHTGASLPSLLASLSSRVSLFLLFSCLSHLIRLSFSLSLSLLVSLCLLSAHLSFFLFSLNNSFNNNDSDRSSSWLSLYTRL